MYQSWTRSLSADIVVRAQEGEKGAVAIEEGEGIAYYKKSSMKREVLALMDEFLIPIAREVGCEEELTYLRKQVVRRRNGAAIQREVEVIKKCGGGESSVIGLLEWLMKRPFTKGFLPPKVKS
jgi:hypothetical protein